MTARRDGAHAILDAAMRSLADTDASLEVETKVLSGAPGDEIRREAAACNAVAIVLGTRGQGGLKRALLGSVSDHVVRNAPCPVVTVNTA